MLVAFELNKTVDEIQHLSGDEFVNWLGFFKLRQQRMDEEARKQQKRNGRR